MKKQKRAKPQPVLLDTPERLMNYIDTQPPEIRALIHEYGFVGVFNMLRAVHVDNYHHLESLMRGWRAGRQAELLR
jgi:hypothetical protein